MIASDVLVVGGGIIGLSAAIAMQQHGYSVILLDANSNNNSKNSISRIYALNQASIELLQELNVWQYLDKNKLSTYNHMYIWDGVSNSKLEFDSRLVGENKLGVMLEESSLKEALLREAENIGINIIFNYLVTQVVEKEDHIIVNNYENKSLCAKLLIAADGANSTIREKVGAKITTWSYNQNAIIANVKTENPHRKTAYQIFNPNGPIAFLPMADKNHCSIVWSTSKAKASYLMGIDDVAFAKELEQAFTSKLGAITVHSPRHQFPLYMRHTQSYCGKHWLLMGDAAHTIHPLAGLGLNVGLADLATWINLLKLNKQKKISQKQLGFYQRKRKYALWQVIALMQGLHVLFKNQFTPISLFRGFGLDVVNKVKPLKKLIIEHASGTKGLL